MPPSISSTITNFLHQSSPAPLQVTFATLEICSYQNEQLLHRVQRQQSRILLQQTPQKGMGEITLLDNLVFSFSFRFRLPSAPTLHEVDMRSLPRPLDQGRLYLDDEKLQLSFRIDAPDPSLRVQVTQVYRGILHLEHLQPTLCGQQR
ncbi:hypothetical protein SAMN04487891_101110 [Flagellimonas taeanensis]|uniref:Uncharacterized protein n=1 Tax=Flagellimonas taeanensis TaxID=1005926 RepID=A0A1M6PBB7_9FLAO|nr:hypothetical protein [Allomuricauda taeanensis]SFB66528.1 hypothetical protein SAMN04487891_101110 [Allomuricauda taeanensis]SHK05217.1 hypothetical protein SAMN05216293_0111 [Allomuricauda taeanensis]